MPPVSDKQARAMFAAANGHSTLGIPKAVGQEFVGEAAPKPKADHHAKAHHHHKAIGDALKKRDHGAALKHTGHLLLALRNAKRAASDASSAATADGSNADSGGYAPIPDGGVEYPSSFNMSRFSSMKR